MKVDNMMGKSLSVTVVVGILMLASCSKNNEVLNSTDVENVSSELLAEACVAEASAMSVALFSKINDSQLGSTPASIPDLSLIDSLLNGASISFSGSGGMNYPQGTIKIDFKTGTTDLHGVLRKGIIKIKYSGRRWARDSSHSISFSGYSRNNVSLDDGTSYTITNQTDSSATVRYFHHVVKGCQLTFPDQQTFLRKAEFTSRIDFESKITAILPVLAGDTTASGKTRYGIDFITNITDTLFYKSQCIQSRVHLPNQGTKSITVGSSKYTVVYGSKLTCSQTTVMVKVGDKATTITVNADGN